MLKINKIKTDAEVLKSVKRSRRIPTSISTVMLPYYLELICAQGVEWKVCKGLLGRYIRESKGFSVSDYHGFYEGIQLLVLWGLSGGLSLEAACKRFRVRLSEYEKWEGERFFDIGMSLVRTMPEGILDVRGLYCLIMADIFRGTIEGDEWSTTYIAYNKNPKW